MLSQRVCITSVAYTAFRHLLPVVRSGRRFTTVKEYVRKNYVAYKGDASFLKGPTDRTFRLLGVVNNLVMEEHKKGVLDVDTKTPSTITSHAPGFIDKNLEIIVGLQTDAPLRLGMKPLGGIKMVIDACKSYGYEVDPKVKEIFTKYRKTQNDAVFDVYSDEIKRMRSNKLLTGLPDSYARGRIIPELPRVPLFGVDKLIEDKVRDFKLTDEADMTDEIIRQREEVAEQIRALKRLKEMAKTYGVDVSKPATSAKEAIQSLYMAYLGTIKESDGAAMSVGRIDAFIDTYIERDIQKGVLTEEGAQELIDDFVLKLRLVRHLRPPEYNELFTGSPTWATLTLGGMTMEGDTLVTKTSFRFLNTLHNMGASAEPNITVLWTPELPLGWKQFCVDTSIKTSSIQYENDQLARRFFGDNAGVACCVSLMDMGTQKQFFGARCNLLKTLLYSINDGVDEISGKQVAPKGLFRFSNKENEPLIFEEVMASFRCYVAWICGRYSNAMSIIHNLHDKYNYEALMHSMHDTDCQHLMAFGIAGISHVADSLSAIKYAKVFPLRDSSGIATGFRVEGDFPLYGNDDDRVDDLAKLAVAIMSTELSKHRVYRNAKPTLSLLTITSNVVYGNHTGSSPDGRPKGQPFAPGASPSYNAEKSGAIASLNSVAKIPYADCLDGISNTFCISPSTLGKDPKSRIDNGVALLDGYFERGAFHNNFNILDKELLIEAQKHPEVYSNLVIRVSGYAVRFNSLTKAQQDDVIARTVFTKM